MALEYHSYRCFLSAFFRLPKRVSRSVRTGSNGPCLEVSVTACAGSREATQKSRPCEASERRPTRCRGHVRVWRGSERVDERVVGLDGRGDGHALRLHVYLGVLRGRRRRCYAKQGGIRCQGGKEGKSVIGFNATKGLGMTYVVCIQDRTNPWASSSSSS